MKLSVHTFPMLDTGTGQEMGYANDAEFVAAAMVEREAALATLTPEARERIEQAEAKIERRVLFGSEASA